MTKAATNGNIPWLYQAWSGRTADSATVEQNLEKLASWLGKHGCPLQETLVVGDRAMLNPLVSRIIHHLRVS